MDIIKEQRFIEAVDALSTSDRASLKRDAGKVVADADSAAMMAYYKAAQADIPSYQDDAWFLCACIRSLWKPEDTQALPLYIILGKLARQAANPESFDNRLKAILDLELDRDGYLAEKLMRLIKMVKQKGYTVDAAQLIYDLRNWNHQERFIQRKWAREYYFEIKSVNDKEGEN